MRPIDRSNYWQALSSASGPWQAKYYAMYSSLWDGVTRDPLLMQLPVDDHLVHRGDGAFDTCKCAGGALYNLRAHLERLVRSAEAIGLRWPDGLDALAALTVATVRAGGQADCAARIILARGPGGLGVSPSECPRPALYILAYALSAPFMRKHPDGARVGRSAVPAKPAHEAGVKNCNYIPNVLMKAESERLGLDFVVGFDEHGCLTEGATENAGIVTAGGELRFPRLERILAGTTMLRVVELAEALVGQGALTSVAYGDIPDDDIRAASEMLLVGTTLNVVAVREYDGRPVGNGRPGPAYAALSAALERDIEQNAALRTLVFQGA